MPLKICHEKGKDRKMRQHFEKTDKDNILKLNEREREREKERSSMCMVLLY